MKKIVYMGFSISVTVAVFVYLLSKVSISEVLGLVRDVDRTALYMFFVLSFAMSFFRTWRYQLLLHLSGFRPNSIALFLIVLVRNLFADLLPARIGTLIYIYLVNTRLQVSLSAATSSFAMSFLFDIFALMPLVVLAVIGAGAGSFANSGVLAVAAVIIGILFWALIRFLPEVVGWIGRILRGLPLGSGRLSVKLNELIDSVAEELTKYKSTRVYFHLMSLSILVRILKYASLYAFLYALLRPLSFTVSDLDVPKVFLGMVTSELIASLPVSGIAGFGAYEGAWAFAFRLLGFPGNIADLTAISHHLFTQIYGYGLGTLAIVFLMLPVFSKKTATGIGRRRPKERTFYFRVMASCVALFILLGGIYDLSKARTRPESQEIIGSKQNSSQLETLSNIFPGRILFDSNRSGTFGIYTMIADGSDIRKIVDNEHHEVYPGASPDGRWVVYAVTQSLARYAPADIWLVDTAGKNPRRLVRNGTFPSFSDDGSTIFFERERKKIMSIDADGSNLRQVYPNNNSAFTGYSIVKPRISEDGAMVAFMSDRGGRWSAWIDNLSGGGAIRLGKGCEPNWYPEGKELIWVSNRNVKAGTGLLRFNEQNGSSKIVQDDGAPFGHEYFPSVSKDGNFLLYSAAPADQHDHAVSNYQIFVKDLNTGNVVRVTFDNFTNRWPTVIPHV